MILLKWLSVSAVALALVLVALLGWFTRDVEGPIPQEASEHVVPAFIGRPAVPQQLEQAPLAEHPFLATNGSNGMHNDSYQSDAYTWGGPLGNDPQVDSEQFHPLVGNCVSAVLDSEGRLISTCVTPFGVTLVARDPASLEVLAREKITHWLPIGNKFGGGVYFHLDNEDRVLLASNTPAIETWELRGDANNLEWHRDSSIYLGDALDAVRAEEHRVIDVQPDWSGNYWFITRGGLVGVADRSGETIRVLPLQGEGIDNAIAVNSKGVFVASDHAMYRFGLDEEGDPQVVWRATYDRGSAPKPGTMGHGTGTTPTLLDERYVAITDNADGRINVVVYAQEQEQENAAPLCMVPVFGADRGTSENSMVAIGDSVLVENNFGYRGPYENIDSEPGLARIRVDGARGECFIAWENKTLRAPSSVPKASLANGLVYVYTRDEANPQDLHAWYLTAVDVRTGEVVFKVLTGVGRKFNNHYGSISITPDGSAYIGTMGGVVRVWDGA